MAPAQTLAHRGWTGSGMGAKPWWRDAVLYRIAPERFQDSDGDGVGDLRGIAQRLDYLQRLGVDAIVLQLPFAETGFDDLVSEASRRHVRLVIGLDRTRGDADLLTVTRLWLSRGAAAILLPASAGAPDRASEDALRRSLRRLAGSFPGERAVIATPLPGAAPVQLGTHQLRLDGPQLTLLPLVLATNEAQPTDADTLVAGVALAARADAPLLELAPGAASDAGAGAAARAVLLLAQHAAVLLEFGQELGEPDPARMPWTPSNTTPSPASPPQQNAASTPTPEVYGAYKPYVPPPPPKPKAADSLPDPDTLPGFSSQPQPADTRIASEALQERDPHSLLTLYRQLIALHHGSLALRGDPVLLQDADGVVVWLHREAGSSVLVAVNTNERAATVSLAADLQRERLRSGLLRPLLPALHTPGEMPSAERLTLAPGGVFVGELGRAR